MTGYAGRLIAEECVKRLLHAQESSQVRQPTVIFAGRNDQRVRQVVRDIDSSYPGVEVRAFELDQAKFHLEGVRVVLHCAGPFSETSKPMMDACLATGTHYLDISGEIEVFQFAKSQSQAAREKGVVLCPGVGFDIVPTDCIAAKLKELLPNAHTINLAFTFGTLPSVGTLHTVIEGLALGGIVRRNKFLQPVSNGYCIRKIKFNDRSRWCVSIPWADVYTSGVSTGVPNGMVLTAMPWLACQLLRSTTWVRWLFATKFAEGVLKWIAKQIFSGGPTRKQRMAEQCQLWGEAVEGGDVVKTNGDAGVGITLTMSAPNVYSITVLTALGIAEHCLESDPLGGFYTASQLMGSSFGLELPGCKYHIERNTLMHRG